MLLEPKVFQSDDHRQLYETFRAKYQDRGNAQMILPCIYLLTLRSIKGWIPEYWDTVTGEPKNADKFKTDYRLSSTTRQTMRLAFQLYGWDGDAMHNVGELLDDWEYSPFYTSAIWQRYGHALIGHSVS